MGFTYAMVLRTGRYETSLETPSTVPIGKVINFQEFLHFSGLVLIRVVLGVN